ncbi:MAG TPA: hypothetical protein VHL05_12450 [Terriglobales bacterium]|jgi:hypothetical protein|nr:hypothetical protein [Terriglobales bacterium]
MPLTQLRDLTPRAGAGRVSNAAPLGTDPNEIRSAEAGPIVSIGGGAVDSVFGRDGAVIASFGDYAASLIANDSASVPGISVAAALDWLDTNQLVKSVFGRTGNVIAALNDYNASQVNNDSGAAGTGATVASAITALAGLLSGAIALPGTISPTQVTFATTNDYNPTGLANAFTLRIDSSQQATFTGLQGGAAGRIIRWRNIGSFCHRFNAEDAGSTAANRFAQAAVVPPGMTATFQYDAVSSRWVVTSRPSYYVLNWGCSTSGGGTANRFIYGWYGGAVAQTTSTVSKILLNHSGWVTDLQYRYITALATANTTLTIQLDDVDTSLVASVPATTTTSPLSGAALNCVAATAGQFISLKSVTSAVDSTSSEPRGQVVFYPN